MIKEFVTVMNTDPKTHIVTFTPPKGNMRFPKYERVEVRNKVVILHFSDGYEWEVGRISDGYKLNTANNWKIEFIPQNTAK